MGTEVALSFSALRTQLENERSSLFKIDENIKKIVQTSGRFTNDRFNASGDYTRGGTRPGGRNSFPDAGKSEDLFGKRRQETKTVFSRLSGRAHDSDGEEEGGGGRRARMPSAVCRELPTRAAVLRAQAGDAQARTRNRRIFGSLLGTLQKFKQEEIGLQNKEEKKAQVERKIEEQARQQKEKELKERKTLFAERDQRKATIKALEAKMGRVQEFEKWEASQKHLGNFILTKAKPHIYWLPKKMSDKAAEKLSSSRKFHEKCMSKKRLELQEELIRIEHRCLRRGPGAKENDPETPHEDKRPQNVETEIKVEHKDDVNDDKGKKRDKFAMDVDKDKEESDGEERNDGTVDTEIEPMEENDKANTEGTEDANETEDIKMDTSAENEPNTAMEAEDTPVTETVYQDIQDQVNDISPELPVENMNEKSPEPSIEQVDTPEPPMENNNVEIEHYTERVKPVETIPFLESI